MSTSSELTHHLMTLTDRKAFILFAAAFVLGIGVLVINFDPLFIMPLLVVCYSGILFVSQFRFYVSLSPETKNSPYFLGFLFTLSCLIHIFLYLPGHDFSEQNSLYFFLVPQVGAALSTTIVGLVGRYMIVSFDPAEEEQQELWRTATSELKENAAAYQKSQKKLLDLIEEFVAAHGEILELEETASKKHIAVLSETSSTLDRLSKDYPDRINSFLELFDAIQGRVNQFLDVTLPKVQNDLTEGTSFQLQKLYNDFIRVAKSSFSKMSTSLEGLDEKIDAFNTSFDDTFKRIPETHNRILKETADQLKGFHDDYMKGLTQNASELNDESRKLNEELKQATSYFEQSNDILDTKFIYTLNVVCNQLGRFGDLAESAQAINSSTADGIKLQIEEFQQVFQGRMNTFKTEIGQIDELIESFIEVTKKRLVN